MGINVLFLGPAIHGHMTSKMRVATKGHIYLLNLNIIIWRGDKGLAGQTKRRYETFMLL